MTAGQEAMREAARIEAAAFYGCAAGDSTIATRRQQRLTDAQAVAVANYRAANRLVSEARAVAEIDRAWHGCDPVVDAVLAGWTTQQIVDRYGATSREVRHARRQIEGTG